MHAHDNEGTQRFDIFQCVIYMNLYVKLLNSRQKKTFDESEQQT